MQGNVGGVKTKSSKIHICLAADKVHNIGISALVNSIKKNTNAPESLVFHKFSVDVDYTMQDILPYVNSNLLANDRLKSPANYVRFILANKLPDVDACWWIDADVIVQGDLVKYSKKIHLDKLVAAFPRGSTYLDQNVYSTLEKEGLKLSSRNRGFNAGIIYLNLALWRENNVDDTIRKICALNLKHSLWTTFGSQPPLQLIAGGDDFVALSGIDYVDGLGWRDLMRFNVRIPQNSMFLHWNGERKPWLSNGLYKEWWDKYSNSPSEESVVFDV